MNRFQKMVSVEGVRMSLRRLDGRLVGKMDGGAIVFPSAVIDWTDRTFTVGTIFAGKPVDVRRVVSTARAMLRRKESGVSFVPAY